MDEQPGPSNQPGTNQQRPPRQIPSNEQEPPNPQGPTTRTRSRSRLRTSNRIAPSNQPETDDQGPSNQPGPSSEPGSSTQEALAVRRPRSRPAPLFRKPRGARVEPGPPSQRGPSNQPGFDREHPAVRDLERELNASSRSLSPPSPEVRISLRDVQPNAEAVPEQNAGPSDRPDRGIEANLGQNAQLDAQPSLEEDSGAYSCPDADAGLNIQPDVQSNPEQAARGDAGEEDLGQVARPDAQPNMEEDAGINLDQNMELDAPAPVDRAPIPEGGSREVSGLEANAGADPGQNIRPDTQPDDGGDPDSDPEEPVAGRSPQLPPLDYEAACHNCFIFRLPKESWNTAYIYANQRVYSEDLRDDDSYMWLRFGANTTRYCYLFEDFVVLLDFDFDKIDDKENYMLRIFEVDYPKERIYDVRIFDTGKKLALHITKDEGQHVRIYEVDANYRSRDTQLHKQKYVTGFTDKVNGKVVDLLNMKGMDTDGKPYRSGGDGDSNRFIWTSEEVNEDRQANTERIRIYEAATGRVLSNIRSNVLPHAEISLLPRSRTIWINEMISNNQYRDKYAWYRIPRALKFNGKLVRPTNEIKRNCKINDHFCTSQWRPVTDYLLQNWLNGELCVYDERFEVWSDRDPSFTVQRVGRRLHKRIKQLRSHSLGDKHAIVSENSLRVDEMKKTMFMLEVNNGQVIARDIGNCTKLSTLKHLFYKIYVEIERSEATELCHQDFKLHLYENIRRCVLLYQREVLEQLRREGIHSN